MSFKCKSSSKVRHKASKSESFEMPDYIINNDGVLLYSNIKTHSLTVVIGTLNFKIIMSSFTILI